MPVGYGKRNSAINTSSFWTRASANAAKSQ